MRVLLIIEVIVLTFVLQKCVAGEDMSYSCFVQLLTNHICIAWGVQPVYVLYFFAVYGWLVRADHNYKFLAMCVAPVIDGGEISLDVI